MGVLDEMHALHLDADRGAFGPADRNHEPDMFAMSERRQVSAPQSRTVAAVVLVAFFTLILTTHVVVHADADDGHCPACAVAAHGFSPRPIINTVTKLKLRPDRISVARESLPVPKRMEVRLTVRPPPPNF